MRNATLVRKMDGVERDYLVCDGLFMGIDEHDKPIFVYASRLLAKEVARKPYADELSMLGYEVKAEGISDFAAAMGRGFISTMRSKLHEPGFRFETLYFKVKKWKPVMGEYMEELVVKEVDLLRTLKNSKWYADAIAKRIRMSKIVPDMIGIMKWGSGVFTKNEYWKILYHMINKDLRLFPWNEIKMGASSHCKLYFVKPDRLDVYLKAWGLKNSYDYLVKHKKEKVPSVLKKLMGETLVIGKIPVKFDENVYKGAIHVGPETAKHYKISAGFKAGAHLKNVIFIDPNMDDGYIHLSAKEDRGNIGEVALSNLALEIDFANSSVNKFSEYLDRVAKFGVMVQMLLGLTPNINLTDVARFWNLGEFSDEFLYRHFGYVDFDGKPMLNWEGAQLKAGKLSHKSPIIEHVLIRSVFSKMKISTPGSYGVAGPAALRPRYLKGCKGWVVRYPGSVPIKTTVYIDDVTGIIYVDHELWYLMGGDFDGDLLFFFPETLMDFKDLPVWPDDKAKMQSWIVEQPKTHVDDPKLTVEKVYLQQLGSQSVIGQVTNLVLFVEECMRLDGRPLHVVVEKDTKLMSNFVQAKIDNLKYAANNSAVDLAEVASFVGELDAVTKYQDHVDYYFALARRGTSIDELAVAAEVANPNSVLWCERIVALWKVINDPANGGRGHAAVKPAQLPYMPELIEGNNAVLKVQESLLVSLLAGGKAVRKAKKAVKKGKGSKAKSKAVNA